MVIRVAVDCKSNRGRFNNYVTLKLPFLTHLPPRSRFATFVNKTPLALRHAQHEHPPPIPQSAEPENLK